MNRITVGSALGTYTPGNGTRDITLSLGYVPTIDQLMYVYNETQDELYYAKAEGLAKCTMAGAVITIDTTFAVLASTDKIHIQLDYPYLVATKDGLTAIETNQTDGTQKTQVVGDDGVALDVKLNPNTLSKELLVNLEGHLCSENSTDTPLGIGEVFTGSGWQDSLDYGVISIDVSADQASATDGLVVQWSNDGITVHNTDSFTILANTNKTFTFGPANRYIRLKYTNGAVGQEVFQLNTLLRRVYVKPSSHRINDAIVGQDDAELVKSVSTGLAPDGTFKNVLVTNTGNQKISIEEFENAISSNSNTQLNVTQFLADGTEGTKIVNSAGLEQYGVHISDVARGKIADRFVIDKFGENADVDVGTEDLWSGGGIWVAPTQARIHQIASTSVNDDGDPAGTGARTITYSGIIADGTRATETKTLNGTTNVPTTNAFTMIDRMEVLTVGNTGSNVGTITATADGDGTVTARIEATQNQTRMAIFQVPTNAQATLYDYYFTINGKTTATTLLTLELKEKKNVANSPWVTKHIEQFNSDVTNDIDHVFNHFKKFSAGSYLKMTVTSNKADASVQGGFSLLVVND